MTIALADLALAYDALFPTERRSLSYPPTAQSIAHINATLTLQLPDSLIWCAQNTGACQPWLASLGEDVDSRHHILHIASRTSKIRRRVIGAQGRWEFVRPAAFIPLNRGDDHDYDCLDGSAFDPSSGEYAIQTWAPPRILGEQRYTSFPQYMEACIRSWAQHASTPVQQAVSVIIDYDQGRSTGR